MEQLILKQVIQALTDGKIPVKRGYPAGTIPMITEPVAAVNLQSADLRDRRITVLVTVLSPAESGAGLCEDTALEAGELLHALGGTCSVGACRLDGRTGLYCTEIRVEYATAVPKLSIGEYELKHAVSFTSWRELSSAVTDLEEAGWNFRLEEFFPLGDSEDADPVETFTLVHTCENGTETYTGCTWVSQRREWDITGLRQIRQGVSTYMETG